MCVMLSMQEIYWMRYYHMQMEMYMFMQRVWQTRCIKLQPY